MVWRKHDVMSVGEKKLGISYHQFIKCNIVFRIYTHMRRDIREWHSPLENDDDVRRQRRRPYGKRLFPWKVFFPGVKLKTGVLLAS